MLEIITRGEMLLLLLLSLLLLSLLLLQVSLTPTDNARRRDGSICLKMSIFPNPLRSTRSDGTNAHLPPTIPVEAFPFFDSFSSSCWSPSYAKAINGVPSPIVDSVQS